VVYDSTTKQFEVIVESQSIEVEDAMSSIRVLIASYWAFNLCFNPKCQTFLVFMCGYVAELPKVKISNSVSRVINTMK